MKLDKASALSPESPAGGFQATQQGAFYFGRRSNLDIRLALSDAPNRIKFLARPRHHFVIIASWNLRLTRVKDFCAHGYILAHGDGSIILCNI